MALDIPPWIKPADEADYTARGLQIGSSIGAQEAAEAMRAQEEARQQQQDAIAQQHWEQQFQIESQEAARKSQAMLGFNQAIQSGTDPLKALLQFGPAMGQPVTSAAAAMRALAVKPVKQIQPPQVAFANFNGQQIPYLVDLQTGKGTWMPSGYAQDQSDTGTLSPVDKVQLADLAKKRDKLQAVQDKDTIGAAAEALNDDELKKANALTKGALVARQKRATQIQDLENKHQAILDQAEGRGQKQKQSVKQMKIARANELSNQNPDWTKDQVIAAVNAEFAQ